MQEAFRRETYLIVDVPKNGFENTYDGKPQDALNSIFSLFSDLKLFQKS